MISKLEILAIKTYQKISHPIYSALSSLGINYCRCRYTPSCSKYTEQAIRTHGAIKGTFMGIKRISRCRPGNGGYDPVK